MKKIGYIYKYNEEEKKGILVYSHIDITNSGEIARHYSAYPILFSTCDCQCNVRSGILVYFEQLSGNKVLITSEADLLNFDVDLINSIVSVYESGKWSDCFELTHIIFENVEEGFFYLPSDFGCFDENENFAATSIEVAANTQNTLEYNEPSVEDIYMRFATSNVLFGYDGSIDIDILNLDFWVDEQKAKSIQCYGRTLKEVFLLYEIFINKRRKALVHNLKNRKGVDENNSIAIGWKYLLSNLSNEELRLIINFAPMLQPALPRKFCNDNISLLSLDYGFPDIEICEIFCKYKISQVNTVEEYVKLSKYIFDAIECCEKYYETERTTLCKMEKVALSSLKELLDFSFKEKVMPVLNRYWKKINDTDSDGCIDDLYINDINDLLIILEILESLLSDSFISNSYWMLGNLNIKFYKLGNVNRYRLEPFYSKAIRKWVINYINTPYENGMTEILQGILKQFSKLLDDNTVLYVKATFQDNVKKITDLGELHCAYTGQLITELIYLEQYERIISDYSIEQLCKIVEDFSFGKYPKSIQEYTLSNIINIYNCKSLDSYECVRIDGYKSFSNLRELIWWIRIHTHDDTQIMLNAINLAIKPLNRQELWALYEEGRIDSLDSSFSGDLLQLYECSRKIMDNVNIELILKEFHNLPIQAQVRILKQLFFLTQTKKINFSILELIELLINSKSFHKPIYPFLFLLKQKITYPLSQITMKELVMSIIKSKISICEFRQCIDDLFYHCDGYWALSNISYFSSDNGEISKGTRNNKEYYVIAFRNYSYIYNECDEETYDEERYNDDRINSIIEIFKVNFIYEYIEGKYWIPIHYQSEIKDFAISYNLKDSCSLFNYQKEQLFGIIRNKYAKSEKYICCCYQSKKLDPIYGVPFYWCNKQICLKIQQFISMPQEWKSFMLEHMLFVALPASDDKIILVKNMHTEIVALLNNLIYQSKVFVGYIGDNIMGDYLNEIDTALDYSQLFKPEEGKWDDGTSIIKDCHIEECETCDDYYYNNEYEEDREDLWYRI